MLSYLFCKGRRKKQLFFYDNFVFCRPAQILKLYGYIDSNQRKKKRYKVKDFSSVLAYSNSVLNKVEDWIPVLCLKIEVTVFMKSKIVLKSDTVILDHYSRSSSHNMPSQY